MWWLLLLLGGGAAIILGKAKNVRGETAAGGERSVFVELVGSDTLHSVILVAPNRAGPGWEWLIPDWRSEAPYASAEKGTAAKRRAAFNAGLSALQLMGSEQLDLPADVHPSSAGMRLDFVNHGENSEGESLIFRVSIVPTKGGWLMQALDPRGTVAKMKVYNSRSKAIHEAFNFVEGQGY